LSDSFIKLSTEKVQVNVINKAVRSDLRNDVMLASMLPMPSSSASRFVLRLMHVSLPSSEGVEINTYSVIYDAIDDTSRRYGRYAVIRDGIVIHNGAINALKRFKDDVKEVPVNFECGISLVGFNELQTGDIIETYEEVEVKQKL
jgi:translation initiation factor IF-2